MKNNKKELGQFFSENYELIEKHVHWIKKDDILIDPFAGEKDLLNFFDNEHIALDIEPKQDDIIYNDSLKNPYNYSKKFLITNPPYLNINKAKNKEIFHIYQTDDLYKASILSIMKTSEKGIIILPTAFWFNEKSSDIRKKFLSNYIVPYVSVFNKQMFKDTTYSVCSFYFEKKENIEQEVLFEFFGKKEGVIKLKYGIKNNFSINEDFLKNLKKYDKQIKIGRLTVGSKNKPSNIFLHCLDTSLPIRTEIKEPFFGISTDRAFLTFFIEGVDLTEEEEVLISELFNKKINFWREVYMDSFLSNYRNDGRKRIGFNLAYKILEDIIVEVKSIS